MAARDAKDKPMWTVGLINSAGKYLTGEKFQSKVVANGATMKKKQIWSLMKVCEGTVALRSAWGKYLSADVKGVLNAGAEEIGDGETFCLETQDDGRVAIKNCKFGRYLGGSGDDISCYDQTVGDLNLYKVQLALHPQINLRNVNRKTYVHLKDESTMNCKEEIPWGYDAMLIIEYHDGCYALRAANTKYLRRDGELVEVLDANCLYTLVLREDCVAFRDNKDMYLTAVGPDATVQSRRKAIGKDELFKIEDSHPQVKLVGPNGKYVSTREGIEVRANHSDVTDTEIFQMEAVDRDDMSGNVKWAFLSQNKRYWKSGAAVTSEGMDFCQEVCQFEIEWMGPMIALKACNGKYVSITSNGKMEAKSPDNGDSCKFVFEFINRPILVLRGEHGFVGAKGASGTLECNRSQYDVFGMTENAGTYNLKGVSGNFWTVEADNTLSCKGDKPTDFFIELRSHTRMAIVAPNGNYLQGSQNGSFTATGSKIDSSTLWEY